MAKERRHYWFVAAVFRSPSDLAAAVGELRASHLAGGLLMLANHAGRDARAAVDGRGDVAVVTMHAGDAPKAPEGQDLAPGLSALLQVMGDGAGDEDDGERQPRIYAQLRRDVADGAVVLIASVANAEEQLLGARVLLRGNCECVLTHEIAAQRP